MPDDWENLVIETGVDSLLNYLAENGKASCGEICDEIGVEESRVKNWADALADENLVEKHHTLTSGLVLEYNKKNIQESEKKKEEIEEELNERSEDLKSRLEDRSKLVNEKREELINEKDSLDEEEKEVAVQDTVVRLEELESEIDKQLENDNLDHQTLKLITEVERILQQVEQLIRKHLNPEQDKKLNEKTGDAVSEVKKLLTEAQSQEEFEEEEQKLRKQLKAVDKLEKNIQKAREREQGKNGNMGLKQKLMSLLPVKKKNSDSDEVLEQQEGSNPENSEKEQGSTGSVPDIKIDSSDKIKEKDFPENSYRELVDENRVTEVMRKISLLKEPDYKGLLRAEKANRNRPDLVDYLEERVNDVGR